METSSNVTPPTQKLKKTQNEKIHRILKNDCFLTLLSKAKANLTQQLLKHCSTEACLSILEIILNTVNKNIPISQDFKRKLKRNKKSLKRLINPNISIPAKKKILQRQYKIVQRILTNFYSKSISKQLNNKNE